MRVGLVSAKGSPGATTLGLAMAATTGGVVVEADPAGGDVECWAGPQGEAGLIRIAGALRHAVEPVGLVDEHAVEVWPGVRAVLAPCGCEQAEPTLVAIGERLASAIEASEGWVVIDGGRWTASQPTARRLAGCGVLAVVMPPTIVGVAHARSMVGPLQAMFHVPVVGVTVGEHGYAPAEIAEALGMPVVGPVAWDPRWVRTMVTVGASRLWRRSPLARSVQSLVDSFEASVGVGVANRG